MALCQAADGWITWHTGHSVLAARNESDPRDSHSRSNQGGLHTCVSTPDYNYVKIKIHAEDYITAEAGMQEVTDNPAAILV